MKKLLLSALLMAAVLNPSYSYAAEEEELVTEEQVMGEPEIKEEKVIKPEKPKKEKAAKALKTTKEKASKETKVKKEKALKAVKLKKEKALKEAKVKKEKALKVAKIKKEKALKEAKVKKEKALKEAKLKKEKVIKEVKVKEEPAEIGLSASEELVTASGKPEKAVKAVKDSKDIEGELSKLDSRMQTLLDEKCGKDAILYANVKLIAEDADALKALLAEKCQLELEDEQDELMADLEKERLQALENLQKMIQSKLAQ